jgi:hypothetical protein
MSPPSLVSVDEAVREFGRSRFVFFQWLREGKLTRYRSAGDRRTLVDRDEIRRLIEPRPMDMKESPDSDR